MNPLTLRMTAFQVLVFLALAFGTLAWIARPEGALIWLLGMASLPVTWIGLKLAGKWPPTDRPDERQTVLNSLIGSGLLIAGALGACALGSTGVMDEGWIIRYAMISNALVLVIIGNGLPKKIESASPSSRRLGLQRLFGWTFVLVGLALVILWLLPLSENLVWILSAVLYAALAIIVLVGLLRGRTGPSEAL